MIFCLFALFFGLLRAGECVENRVQSPQNGDKTIDLLVEESKNDTQIKEDGSNSTSLDRKREKRVIYHIPSYFGETSYIPLFGGRTGLLIRSNFPLFGRRRNGYYNNYYGNSYYGNNYNGNGYGYGYNQPYTWSSPTYYQPAGFYGPAGQCQVIRYLGYDQWSFPYYQCWCSNVGYFEHHMRTRNYAPCANNLPTNALLQGYQYHYTSYGK